MSTLAVAERLRTSVARAARKLGALSESEAARPRAPGKWSPKEVLGHLVDSASNNHQRFVRAHFQEDLVFPGYEQDDWVAVERWQQRPWLETLELWRLFNLHLAHVIESTPAELAQRVHTRHNLHLRAWRSIAESEPATLEWFMEDYVLHLEHHLVQAGG
jgi:DinB superfamily